jgi:hypothetical protein
MAVLEEKMNAFNRIVTTLLLLILIPIVTIALLAPREAIELVQNGLENLHGLVDSSPSGLQMLIRIVAALLIDVLLVLVLYLDLRRPSPTSVRVQRARGSEAQIALDSVSDRLVYHVDRLSGVLNVVPVVTPHRGGVKILLEIDMAADEDVPACIDEIVEVTRRVVEQDMGLKLKGKPKLNLRTVQRPGSIASAATWDDDLRQASADASREQDQMVSPEDAWAQSYTVESELEDTQTDDQGPIVESE